MGLKKRNFCRKDVFKRPEDAKITFNGEDKKKKLESIEFLMRGKMIFWLQIRMKVVTYTQ